MEPITYSLRQRNLDSDSFYRDLAQFTSKVVAEAERRAGVGLEEYLDFIQDQGYEPLRTRSEYALELLYLGVLWHLYLPRARHLPVFAASAASHLNQLFETQPGFARSLRGALFTLFFQPPNSHASSKQALTLSNLDRLLTWLGASGNFQQILRRLRGWRLFFEQQPLLHRAATLSAALELAGWFEPLALKALGRYTSRVDSFLKGHHRRYRFRGDLLFTGSQRVEYHLSMIATEILNRACRSDFLAAGQKIVILPSCTVASKGNACPAEEMPDLSYCATCDQGCGIYRIARLGEQLGFQTLVQPCDNPGQNPDFDCNHNGKNASLRQDPVPALAATWRETPVQAPAATSTVPRRNSNAVLAENGSYQLSGLIRVSCPLAAPAYLWESRDEGIPTQGLLLDYCGCQDHWHPGGLTTTLNLRQLRRLLDPTPW